jgi:glutamyl/glutaminyl-tRNA synthetase
MKTLKDFKNLVIPKDLQLTSSEKNIAKALSEKFSKIKNWNKEAILAAMRETLNTHKAKGSVLYKIVTGFESGLPLPETLEILGKEKTLDRIKSVIN